MNKHLLYSAILVAAVSANEAKAQVTAPDAPVPVQLNLDGKDTVYVYNVAAKLWLNAGNAWKTQTSLCAKGMKVLFVPNKSDGVPNKTYSLYNNSTSDWTRRVFYNGKDDNGGTSYVDYGSQGINRCNWEVYLNNDKKTFELQADTIEFQSETTNTRAGWNAKDPKKINESGEKDATDEIFRPILDMKSANKADYGVEWMAVSQEGYDCYLYRKDEMMDIINKAIEAGIDVGNAVTVYNDEKSTLAQLKEAAQYVKDMTRNKAMEGASSSNVIDITEYIPNADCNSATGWDIVCPDADKDGNKGSGGHGFTWKHNGSSYTAPEDGHECKGFLERWVHEDSKYGSTSSESDVNNGHLSNSSLSQTLKNLPKGGYKITAYVNACQQGKQTADVSYRVNGVYLYAIAGDEEKTVKVATAAGKPEKVTLSVIVDGDTDLSEMTFGMKTENTTANWVFLDDVTIQYFGSDAMFMVVQAAKDEASKAADKVTGYSCTEDYQNAVFALQEQIEDLDATATTQDEVDQLLNQLRSAMADADESDALYAKLNSLGDELTLLTTNADGKYDTKDLQAAYDDCGTGETYEDLCGSYTLNNAKLKAYIEKLQKLMASTRKSAVKEGADCTEDLLTNPTFKSATGWNNTGAAINTTYQNAESYQGTFNLYQDITNIPDGVYEITVQAMHRVDNNDNASKLYPNDVNEITACLYGNDITAKFASPYSYGMSEQKVTSGNADYAFNGKYIPNSMQGFAAACAESNEAYLTKVYALVTDGTLRVGVKEEARPAGHSGDWAIFDNFKITYRGTSEAVLQQCVNPLIEQANALLEGKMYEGKKSSLQKAVDAVNTTLNMDNIKALALEIKNAQAAIDAYKPLATAIENVKARYESNETTANTSAEAKNIYNTSLKKAEDAYSNGTVAEENIETAIKELNKGYTQYFIYDVVAAAENGASVDISKVINNYDFATMDKTGWTIKVTQNAAGFQKNNNIKAVEFYDNKGFDLYQELVGMPAGTYKLSARAYYRLKSGGNIDDVVNAFVYYANSKEADAEPVAKADVKSIYTGAITKDDLGKVNLTSTDGMSQYNGSYYVPNDMITGQRFLTSDEIGPKYDSKEITFDYDGTSPFYIGVANTNKEKGKDWTFVKSFKLSYVKGTTGIENINGEKAGDVVSTKIYDINGVQYNSLKPGVNIVKSVMSDGSVKVRKVVVK